MRRINSCERSSSDESSEYDFRDFVFRFRFGGDFDRSGLNVGVLGRLLDFFASSWDKGFKGWIYAVSVFHQYIQFWDKF